MKKKIFPGSLHWLVWARLNSKPDLQVGNWQQEHLTLAEITNLYFQILTNIFFSSFTNNVGKTYCF